MTAAPGPVLARPLLTVGINRGGYLGNRWTAAPDPDRFLRYDHYREVTRTAHEGTLDAVFFSDHPALQRVGTQDPLHTFDPLILLSALATDVPDIGLVLTASTTYNSPYNLARRLATLDHVSGGRAGWNAVSSFNPAVAANFGDRPVPGRAERYARAAEFLDVAFRLWSSWQWEPADSRETPGRWDPQSASPIDHHGAQFDVAGPLNVPEGPQVRPLIVQAGGSDQGRDLAARYADVVYTAQFSQAGSVQFTADLRARAVRAGRAASSVKVLPGLVVVVGSTEEEARRRSDTVRADTDEAAAAELARRHGLDPASLDLDAPADPALFAPDPDQALPVGFSTPLHDLLSLERVTLREALRRSAGGHRFLAGTPEQIAADIVGWWRAGAADGFTLLPPELPHDLRDFVEHVVPVLRRDAGFPDTYGQPTLRERFGAELSRQEVLV